jgi:hypothetical protein
VTGLAKLLDEARQQRSESFEARNLVEKIYEAYMEPDEVYRQKHSFAPSSLFYGSGTCAKRWFLSFRGGTFENKTTPLSVAGMKNGIDSHARIQAAMLKSGVASAIEVKVTNDDPPILGYIDAILVLSDESEALGEIKTTKHSNFEYRVRTNKISDYHVAQILPYMRIKKLDKAIVIYESKDTNELHPIAFNMTDEYNALTDSIFDWMRRVWQMHIDDIMPARSYRKGSKVCAGCPVEKLCNEKDGVVSVERLNYTL